jgi:hypothetical protein
MDRTTEDNVDHMIREGIKKHVNLLPHHEPPCAYFKDHKRTFFWAIGAIAAAALIFGGFLLAEVRANSADNNLLKLKVVEMTSDLKYIAKTVDEIKAVVPTSRGAK